MRFVNVYPTRRVKRHQFPANYTTTKRVVKNNPAINILENEDNFLIELAAPGLQKSDFHLNVENEALTISVEKKAETPEGVTYTRREFAYGDFKRTFNLPESVDTEQINAEFLNGILRVTLGKKEEAKPQPARQIEIS